MTPRRPSDTSDGNTNTRLEPKLLRAAEAGNVQQVRGIVEEAQRDRKISDKLLSIGLLRSCEKGHIDVTRYLLSQGAKTDFVFGNKIPPLLRAVEYGQIQLVQLLCEYGIDLDVRNKKGRTALMTAAFRGFLELVKLLIAKGANVHSVDSRKRNALHNLAADKKCPENKAIAETLLDTTIDLEARDELGRTPLHWTAVYGHTELAKQFLSYRRGKGADTSAHDVRRKTPLHFAAAHNRIDMVKLLLQQSADVRARSDGDWTPLHNACEKGSTDLVQALLDAGAEINGILLNGRTPLHIAAEYGNAPVAHRLLQQPGVKRSIKDRFGDTPLLRAAQTAFAGKTDIIELLAPWNHVDALSPDAIDACKEFNATVVDFGNYHNGNKVSRRSVYDLLYARDPQDPSKHAVSTLPRSVKATKFRWIHLPANNIAWCNALLTKRFIEEGAADVEGFKALERSFGHQHRGRQHHSHFMRPVCQTERRAPAEPPTPEISNTAGAPTVVVNGPVSITNGPNVLPSMPETPMSIKVENQQQTITSSPGSNNDTSSEAGKRGRKGSTDTKPGASRSKPKPKRTGTFASTASSGRSPLGRKTHEIQSNSNIYLFMPYLHFETDKRRREMQQAVEHVTKGSAFTSVSHDEKLIRAHLTASSSVLHIRRTLDQYFYHNIDTHVRDSDQVVYRYQTREQVSDSNVQDPKVVMVDQLWIWILGKDLVVTSFPQRWRQPNNDPLNVLEGIVQDINSKTRDPVQNVYELAMLITGRCFGTFDRHKKGDDDFQLVDMFEASIGNAMDQETSLFQEFSDASKQASLWLHQHQTPNRLAKNLDKAQRRHESEKHALDSPERFRYDDHSHGPLFVDKLLNIGQETSLLAEIKDIRDELMIMRIILENQEHIIPDMRDAIRGIYKDERSDNQVRKIEKGFDESLRVIHTPLKDIDRMDKQAERIYSSIRDLLDLKQKHANAFEARFARDQAAGTARQAQTIMVFTIVTVIFLPLSFVAAFFTMNISSFPHNTAGNQEVSLAYASKYIFGIGIAISIPCIMVALSVDALASFFGGLSRRFQYWWWKLRSGRDPDAARQINLVAMEKTLSVAKSTRRSAEIDLVAGKQMQWRSLDVERRSANGNGWIGRKSWDVERGRR